MRVLVTGGNGFIGSGVTSRLAADGHEVVCLLRAKSRTDRLNGTPYQRAPGDVRDADSVRRAMRGCDCTIHLAAPGGWEADDPALLREVIEEGTRHVLQAAAAHRVHRVVVVSSTAAVAASEVPRVFDERTPFDVGDPSLHYAHAKHRAEQIALAAHAAGGDVVIVNPAEVYGPGDTALVTAGNLIDFATAMPVLVCDGGTSVVCVDDVTAAIVAALERGRAGERYILGGDNLTIRQLAELVLALRGRRAPVVTLPTHAVRVVTRLALRAHVPLPYDPHVVPYATRYWFVANDKARRELGVEFRGARDTIDRTLRWLEHAGRLSPRRLDGRA